nr:PaaI family thioesterase [Jiangella gansuensis]
MSPVSSHKFLAAEDLHIRRIGGRRRAREAAGHRARPRRRARPRSAPWHARTRHSPRARIGRASRPDRSGSARPSHVRRAGPDRGRSPEAEEGRVVVHTSPQEFHYNPLGTVHGGVLATILDTATGCAVHSVLPAGVGYTSLDLTTKFLRPVTVASGELRCEGTVISRGRTTALAEARMTDGAGRLVAHAVSTCLLFEAAPPSP